MSDQDKIVEDLRADLLLCQKDCEKFKGLLRELMLIYIKCRKDSVHDQASASLFCNDMIVEGLLTNAMESESKIFDYAS
jgi:hypothetical protein